MIDLQDVTYRIAGRVLFENISAQFPSNHKIGLVGRNGSGKSTLFKLIRGEIQTDSGTIGRQSNIKIGWVAQEMPSSQDTPLEFVLKSDEERHGLMEEVESSTDPYRLAEVHHRLLEIDAYETPAKAAKILAGLGFTEADQNKPLSSFSGGWRMRVALAAALFCEPDLLLLDEPTNHLDLEATAWLENYLRNYSQTIIMISHDRHLLNNVVTRIYHLTHNQLKQYNGNYDFFEKTRKEQLLVQQAALKKQQANRDHIQNFIDRFRANPSRARLVQSRVKMLEKFEPIAILRDEASIKLSFPEAGDISPPMITLEGASAGYGNKIVLRNLNHRIDPEDRIALLGRNGNGKTTFAKILAGSLAPLSGKVVHHPKLKIGYFHQHQIDALDIEATAYDHLAKHLKNAKPEMIRAHLGRFGITQEMSQIKVKNLSGGEKARLNFALISCGNPNILILDEPTNHLDMASRENLIMALNDFNGAVVLITHDRFLLEHTVDRFWLVGDQQVKPFDGDLNDYYTSILGKSSKPSRSDEIKQQKHSKKSKQKNDLKDPQKNKPKKKNRGEGFVMD